MKKAWISEDENSSPDERTAVQSFEPCDSQHTQISISRLNAIYLRKWLSRVLNHLRWSLFYITHLQSDKCIKMALRAGVGIVSLVCLSWTIFLVALNIAPNATVNYVMNTEHFEHGTFWLLKDPSLSTYVMTLVALGPVGIFYVVVLVHLHRNALHHRFQTISRARIRAADSLSKEADNNSKYLSRTISSTTTIISRLRSPSNKTRKLANAWMKLADLGVQIVLLVQLLERGLPMSLVSFFAAIVVANSTFCTAVMLFSVESASFAVVHAVIDTIFDFFISVGHPLLVIFYCLASFSLDRRILAINVATFPPGAFLTNASVLVDRAEFATILQSLYALMIYSPLRMFATLGSNIALCYRLHTLGAFANGDTTTKLTSMYPRRHPITVLFVLISVGVCAFVGESIRTSTVACSYHPECAVNAWRWTQLVDSSSDGKHLSQCPCLAMIDVEEAPKSYDAWTHPPNATDKLARLATTGDLHTIEIVNRLLPTFPEELRGCTSLKHLSLIYTQTTSLPHWTKEFTRLEYIHIEGSPFGSLTSLPDDLFDDMSHLTFIHIGVQPMLVALPRLTGLVNLQSLTLAVLLSLQELPSFDTNTKLQMLYIIMCPTLDSIPDMTALTSLQAFVTVDRGTYCCNGFREPDGESFTTSTCDLNHSMCRVHPVWGTPAAECLPANRTDKRMTPGTRAVFQRFTHSVCVGEAFKPSDTEGNVTEEYVQECGGTMYRQCSVGMCFNTRWMAISCEASPFPITMRREQIREGVGTPCDPDVEAWLGCGQ